MLFKELKHLTTMGCKDSDGPEKYSERDLSSVHDAMRTLELTIGEDATRKVWEALPHELRMDYTWSFWKYHARKSK